MAWDAEELRSLVRGIAQFFRKNSSRGSKGDPWLNQLSHLHAPTFKGRDRFEECEAWLLKVEKILESMVCLEDNWVQLASFLLEGDADQWWRATRRLKFPNSDLLMISWKEFRDAFYEKYFLDKGKHFKQFRGERDRLDREFRGLQ